jgi:RND family efflux transporter MFP subunit
MNYFRKIMAITLLLAISLSVTACGKKDEEEKKEVLAEGHKVSTRLVSEASELTETLEFPGLIASEQEARIIAKTGGTVKGFVLETGDRVSTGQLLLTIDDAKGGQTSGADTAQIQQALIAVSQTESALRLALANFDSTLVQAEKDLASAEIAKKQAESNQDNLSQSNTEAIKSAEIALEQAVLGVSIAKTNLDKQKKIIEESKTTALSNARVLITGVIDQSRQTIDNINRLTAFDDSDGTSISYSLGALDVDSFAEAKSAYLTADKELSRIIGLTSASDSIRAEAAISLAQKIKTLADSFRALADNTVSSSNLPEASLTALKSSASSYQSLANNLISQANNAKQALTGSELSSDLNLSSLEKALELAQKQENQAKQALTSLRTGQKGQTDAAGYGVDAARQQYESIKNRLEREKQAAQSQLEAARLTYQNAQTALQGLYDIHDNISPIDGLLVKKLAKDGDTVSAGQELAIVSQPERIKLSFYVDEENVRYIGLGAKAAIKDNSGKKIDAVISAITPMADAASKRFEVEMRPSKESSENFSLGTVMTAVVTIKKGTTEKGNIILPLSAIEVGQNESAIYIVSEEKAKKETVEVVRVIGEAAELKTELDPTTAIIIEGAKEVEEGDSVKIEN